MSKGEVIHCGELDLRVRLGDAGKEVLVECAGIGNKLVVGDEISLPDIASCFVKAIVDSYTVVVDACGATTLSFEKGIVRKLS